MRRGRSRRPGAAVFRDPPKEAGSAENPAGNFSPHSRAVLPEINMETFKKRQKEMRRLERQRDKAARRIQRKQNREAGISDEPTSDDPETATPDQSPATAPTTDVSS